MLRGLIMKHLLILNLFFLLPCVLSDDENLSHPIRALLIGIDEYSKDAEDPKLEIPQLLGCKNDVKYMKNLLLSRFHFKFNEIKTIIDEEASRRIILNLIETMFSSAKEENHSIVIYFSGHGSRFSGGSLDEIDGVTETLVPFDGREPGKRDVTDNELRNILEKFPSVYATFILDSCFSGGMFRGQRSNSIRKWIEPDLRTNFPEVDQEKNKQNGGFEAVFFDSPRTVLISASTSHQQAYQKYHKNLGNHFSNLTVSLVNAIDDNDDLKTFRDLKDILPHYLDEIDNRQTPTIIGLQLDNLLFSKNKMEAPFYVLANPIQKNYVRLDTGKSFCLSEGSEFIVYPPFSKRFSDDLNPALCKVIDVGPFESIAEIETKNTIRPGSRSVPVNLLNVKYNYNIYLDEYATFPIQIKDRILSEIQFQLAGYENSQATISYNNYLSGEYVLLKPKFLREIFFESNYYDFVNDINDIFGQLSNRFSFLTTTGNSRFLEMQLELIVRETNLSFENQFGFIQKSSRNISDDKCCESIDLNSIPELYCTLNHGEDFAIKIKNNSKIQVYLYIVVLSMDGSLYQIFPTFEGAEPLNGGSYWTKNISVDAKGCEMGCYNFVKLILTTKLLPYGYFNRPPIDASSRFTESSFIQPEEWISKQFIVRLQK